MSSLMSRSRALALGSFAALAVASAALTPALAVARGSHHAPRAHAAGSSAQTCPAPPSPKALPATPPAWGQVPPPSEQISLSNHGAFPPADGCVPPGMTGTPH
jgi:hypothetical protein